MGQRKRQIFLSSTYEDLIEHRLPAMQEILKGGHIPAAMEHFVAGGDTALERIRNWIDESDAFILVLGGRYGSVEPLSGKSYVQLEYEYAIERQKPFCALVISQAHLEERIRKFGLSVDEREHAELYRQFRRSVETRVCKHWADARDIEIEISRKPQVWAQRSDLIGWIRGDGAPSAAVANELARLSQENHALRARVAQMADLYDGMTFEQMVRSLRETPLEVLPGEHNLRAALELGNSRVARTLRELIDSRPGNAGELFDGSHEAAC